jgi:hypothetical protein
MSESPRMVNLDTDELDKWLRSLKDLVSRCSERVEWRPLDDLVSREHAWDQWRKDNWDQTRGMTNFEIRLSDLITSLSLQIIDLQKEVKILKAQVEQKMQPASPILSEET